MTTESRSSRNNSNSKGIDFQQAYEILSSRAAAASSSTNDPNGGSTNKYASCPCHPNSAAGAIPLTTFQNMGQVIDLNEDDTEEADPARETTTDSEALKARQQELEQARVDRQAKLTRELQSMSTSELLRTVLEAQQQRVATYSAFNEGLDVVLATRNLSLYPALCADATASFAVSSDTINAVGKVLDEDKPQSPGNNHGVGGGDWRPLLGRLQTHEQRKLQITAAWHLERIRWQSIDPNTDPHTERLLRDGIQSLRTQLDGCVDSINEVLDELQSALLDQTEEGQE